MPWGATLWFSVGLLVPPAATDSALGDAMQEVELAIEATNDEPAAGVRSLTGALEKLAVDPVALAESDSAQRLRLRGQLTLARARLAAEDELGATAAMDEAIRTHGSALDVGAFGPTLADLFASRRDALARAGTGTIEVECGQPCRVFVNERPAEASVEVLAGPYRVHVESLSSSDIAPLDVELDVAGRTAVRWPMAPDRESLPAATAAAPPDEVDRSRTLPRWSEIALMAAGAVAVGVGAVMLAIEGRCPGGADPRDAEACPQVYTTKNAGIATLVAGSSVFVVGGVLLGIDEVRVGRARAKSVSLGLHLRF